MKRGIYTDISIEAYHSGPGISKTGLDDIDRSPAIFHALHLNPARPPRGTSGGQLEGSLAHCAILEPDEFDARYAVGPSVNRNTKVWKEFVEGTDRIAIQADQYDTAMRQRDSVHALPEVRAALARGVAEQSAYWTDATTGELCRCRPDWTCTASAGGVVLLDVKTCSDASPGDFSRQIARKRYHVQSSFYSDGYAAASGLDVLAFVFVAVENTWPYAACALMLDEPSREAGRAAYLRNLATYAECRRTGVWPGYSPAIELISLPAWATREAAALAT